MTIGLEKLETVREGRTARASVALERASTHPESACANMHAESA